MQLTKRTKSDRTNVPVDPSDPTRSLPSVQRAMERLFNDHMLLTPFRSWHPQAMLDGIHEVPRVDISETDVAVKVRAEVPGIDPKDVVVEVTEDTVSLSGTVERSIEEQQENYYQAQRRSGRFVCEFTLPCKVKTDTATAISAYGVTTLSLEKQPSEFKKRVEIT